MVAKSGNGYPRHCHGIFEGEQIFNAVDGALGQLRLVIINHIND
jgi:hypothetical protein